MSLGMPTRAASKKWTVVMFGIQ